ncbi:ATP-binding cassette domain-containing protein [Microbacteriaceae bacterium VKM Ac-2854]|nr:ATP-binding cassette domain-containing protein [Microbacteriaceae bacterium VKM Ac-2854]
MTTTIEFCRFTKSFGGPPVVEDLDFAVERGTVVGLLGPNGAGKSTAMRGLVGLLRPDSGQALINARPFGELRDPARVIGVHLDGLGFENGITGYRHLAIVFRALGLPLHRIDDLLDRVGLAEAGRVRVRSYSTGMRQRLGLATALAGDPEILLLDEPANGLDPEGIRWLRRLIREEAEAGRTVLVSSHQLAELEHTVDEVVVMRRRLLFHGRLDAITRSGDQSLEDGYFDLVDKAAVR